MKNSGSKFSGGPSAGCNFSTPVTIVDGTGTMMGDNRDDTDDSRFREPGRTSWIVGRVIYCEAVGRVLWRKECKVRRSARQSLLAILVGIVVSLGFAPSALAAETGQIAGWVTFPGGGVPVQVSDVDVCAYSVEGEVSACENPGSFSGEYAIKGLAAGEYKVGFASEGLDLLGQYYDDKTSLAQAEPVSVTAGQTLVESMRNCTRPGRSRVESQMRPRTLRSKVSRCVSNRACS